MKKLISLLLVLATMFSLFMVACGPNPDPEPEEENEEAYHVLANANVRGTDAVEYEVETVDGRKYLYFGMYPQNKVIDNDVLAGLSEYVGELPTSHNSNGWTVQKIPNEYGTPVNIKSNYSFFKDVKYDGEYYRARYFTELRIYHPGSVTIPGYENKPAWGPNCQAKRGYNIDTVYWFKYEPIRWEVLQEWNGEMFLFSEKAIDSSYWGYDGTNIKNNYEKSEIRNFLNEEFLYYAFTKAERALMNFKTIRNDGASTTVNSNGNACKNTTDKVALLSLEEATRQNYGFKNELRDLGNGKTRVSEYGADPKREKRSTDYTNCQGLHTDASEKDLFFANWWTRSPAQEPGRVVYAGGKEGVTDASQLSSCLMGVCPIIYVQAKA